MNRTRLALTAFAASLAASLLLARVHPFGDAGLYEHSSPPPTPAENISLPPSIPPGPRALLAQKCADCHSTQARAPLYARLAPISWLLERDILSGRRHMDLSRWDTYTPDRQQTLLAKIVQETRSGGMPLPAYRLMHPGARLTQADHETLRLWARGDAALETSVPAGAATGDAVRGKQIFEKRCTGCHALQTNREGPALAGVVGRTSGQFPGFTYSDALRKAQIHWDDRTLDQWLTDPDALVPGNNMEFHVANPQERTALIQFLKQSALPPS